jgi:hypothetical protein
MTNARKKFSYSLAEKFDNVSESYTVDDRADISETAGK